LSKQQENDETAKVDYEGGIPVLRRLSEMERKQNESDRREREQIRLNRSLVIATVALVICTVALGGVQSCYMHRQWKLTSEGLSKLGDQIWAGKDAAYASESASRTATNALTENQRQFNKTLRQMKAQTVQQWRSAAAAQTAASAAKESVYLEHRARVFRSDIFVHLADKVIEVGKPFEVRITFQNTADSPALNAWLDLDWASSRTDGHVVPDRVPDSATPTVTRAYMGVVEPRSDNKFTDINIAPKLPQVAYDAIKSDKLHVFVVRESYILRCVQPSALVHILQPFAVGRRLGSLYNQQ
jgi:hypothetical protein